MPGSVNLPILGKTNKATLAIAGVAGIGTLGYVLYQKHKKSTTGTASATGYGQAGYGQAGYGQYGYGNYTYEPYGTGFGPEGLGNYGSGGGGYGYGYYGAGVGYQVQGAATSNAQWSEAVVSALTNQGFTGTTVLAAVGIYLTGGTLDANQVTIVQAAIAAEGYPPVSGPNGYPPQWHTTTSTGQTGTTPPTNPTPGGGGEAHNPNPSHSTLGPPSGIHATKVNTTSFQVGWNPVSGATGYRIRVTYQDKLVRQFTTTRTIANVGSLGRNHTYTVHVATINHSGIGPESNGPAVKTK